MFYERRPSRVGEMLALKRYKDEQEQGALAQDRFYAQEARIMAIQTMSNLMDTYKTANSRSMREHTRKTMRSVAAQLPPMLAASLQPFLDQTPISPMAEKLANFEESYPKPTPLEPGATDPNYVAYKIFEQKDYADAKLRLVGITVPPARFIGIGNGEYALRDERGVTSLADAETLKLDEIAKGYGTTPAALIQQNGLVYKGSNTVTVGEDVVTNSFFLDVFSEGKIQVKTHRLGPRPERKGGEGLDPNEKFLQSFAIAFAALKLDDKYQDNSEAGKLARVAHQLHEEGSDWQTALKETIGQDPRFANHNVVFVPKKKMRSIVNPYRWFGNAYTFDNEDGQVRIFKGVPIAQTLSDGTPIPLYLEERKDGVVARTEMGTIIANQDGKPIYYGEELIQMLEDRFVKKEESQAPEEPKVDVSTWDVVRSPQGQWLRRQPDGSVLPMSREEVLIYQRNTPSSLNILENFYKNLPKAGSHPLHYTNEPK